ncbi:MAG: pyruvate, water dikinase regulatory protein [Pseudomonadota bacterium]
MIPQSHLTVHIVSDATGGTAASAVRAVSALFAGEITERSHVFVRSEKDIDDILSDLEHSLSLNLLVYTLTDHDLRDRLERGAAAANIQAIALLSPLIEAFKGALNTPPARRPGGQHRIGRDYLDRISALDFAMAHDDGQDPGYLLGADVILVGVSRTSKTPTSIYLAYQGIRAANVPLVPGQKPPSGLLEALKAGIPAVGLIATPNRLAQIREHRLSVLERNVTESYASLDTIRSELAEARLFFDRYDLPVIDVTRRSIEETAASIKALIKEKQTS